MNKNKLFKTCLILLVILLPIFIHATKQEYDSSKSFANNYYTKFNTPEKYLRFSNYYIYDGSLKSEIGLTKGGLLSIYEFKTTLNGKSNPSYSYLFDGTSYWAANNRAIYDDPSLVFNKVSDIYDVKVTEYTKHNIKVKGIGTYDNPWIFINKYNVYVTSTGNGNVEVKDKTKIVNNNQTEEVYEGENAVFDLTPDNGFVYHYDNCGITSKVEDNVLTISNVSNNINCMVTFKEDNSAIVLPTPKKTVNTKLLGDTERTFSNPKPTQIFQLQNMGFFKDSEFTERLSMIVVPYRRGWTFNGYYINEIKESNKLVSGYTYVKGKTNYDSQMTTNYTLVSGRPEIKYSIVQNQYTVTYNADGGNNGQPISSLVIFESDIPTVIKLPTKAGSIFDGYYTAKNGGKCSDCYESQYYKAVKKETDTRYVGSAEPINVWNEDANTTLYAKWKLCSVGHYCPGDNGELECPPGTYQDEEGKTTCKPCPKGSYQNLPGQKSCKLCTSGTYQNEEGQTTCKNCPSGTISGNGATSCASSTSTIAYDGCKAHPYKVAQTGNYKIELWGAQGYGGYSNKYGGLGAYTSGTIHLEKDTTLYFYIGAAGTSEGAATCNGGGKADGWIAGGSGGGATDVRLVKGEVERKNCFEYYETLTDLINDNPKEKCLTVIPAWKDEDSLKSRIMVAAGGGGSGADGIKGGDGGTFKGKDATGAGAGRGGTQVEGGGITSKQYWGNSGEFGFGGGGSENTNKDSNQYKGGGGGGGYYGGGGGSGAGCGGGGSSFISGRKGYIAINKNGKPKCSEGDEASVECATHYSKMTFTNASHESGVNEGNGKVKITFLGS